MVEKWIQHTFNNVGTRMILYHVPYVEICLEIGTIL